MLAPLFTASPAADCYVPVGGARAYLHSHGVIRRLVAGDELVPNLAVAGVQLEVRSRTLGHADFDAAVRGRQIERAPGGLIHGNVAIARVGEDVRADAAQVDVA